MPSFWKHVNKVLKEADLIIEVLDARMIEESRNEEIEDKINRSGKKILYVINKSDLVNKIKLEEAKKKLKPSIFVSSREKLGTTILKKKILELAKGKKVVVGVVGYPNTGKSSLINALTGKGKARTSPESGYTKGLQRIKVDNKITLLDTPGVFPNKEKGLAKHVLMGAVSFSKIKDPETAALRLIEENQELIKKCYHLVAETPEGILEEIAFRFKMLIKGGEANLDAAARFLLKDWQTGKIKS